jgi:hypothetical protein
MMVTMVMLIKPPLAGYMRELGDERCGWDAYARHGECQMRTS